VKVAAAFPAHALPHASRVKPPQRRRAGGPAARGALRAGAGAARRAPLAGGARATL
jgi:hypothetical protein